MQEENIRNRKRSHRLSGARAKPHENSRSQKTSVAGRDRSPNSTSKINSITNNIDRPSSILIDERHPDQVPSTLHKGRSREKVSRLVDRRPEVVGVQLGIRKELHGCFNNGNGWACGKEIADHHREADNEG